MSIEGKFLRFQRRKFRHTISYTAPHHFVRCVPHVVRVERVAVTKLGGNFMGEKPGNMKMNVNFLNNLIKSCGEMIGNGRPSYDFLIADTTHEPLIYSSFQELKYPERPFIFSTVCLRTLLVKRVENTRLRTWCYSCGRETCT